MTNYIHPLGQHYLPKSQVNKQPQKSANSFKDILANVNPIKISKHAESRLKERKIDISTVKWQQIGEKIHEAKAKGVTDALVVTDNVALVVSTKNNTVVTALNSGEATNKIFTNINGTILL